ncbi:MAG: 50S ribosomal protein L34e [Candidatus Diapherotrites archaeon]
MGRKAKSSRKKIYRKTPSGKIIIYFEKKAKKCAASCALCHSKLAGTVQAKKGGKSKKRPSVMFGGVLCNKCRSTVFEEALKVKENIKKLEDCDVKERPYIEQALKSF